jgi:hypothetical protein
MFGLIEASICMRTAEVYLLIGHITDSKFDHIPDSMRRPIYTNEAQVHAIPTSTPILLTLNDLAIPCGRNLRSSRTLLPRSRCRGRRDESFVFMDGLQ